MVYFRARTYKKFFRVRVPIQPQKEVRWHEESFWIAAETANASVHQSPSFCSTACGYLNGLRSVRRSQRRQRSSTPISLLRGGQGLRLAFVQSSRGEAAHFAPTASPESDLTPGRGNQFCEWITRPSPVPEWPLVVKKGTVKMCGQASGGIPLPLSAISTRKNSPSRPVRRSMRPVPPTA
jgi:hypothetical protein